MRALRFGCTVAAVALLAGCGGTQTSTGGAMTGAPSGYAAHAGSWMKPGSSASDLLYVLVGGDAVDVFTYPGDELVGTLTGLENAIALCSDASGNVR
jgi:hypothetical protein